MVYGMKTDTKLLFNFYKYFVHVWYVCKMGQIIVYSIVHLSCVPSTCTIECLFTSFSLNMLNAALQKHVTEMQSLSSNRNSYNWFIIMFLAFTNIVIV